jgi:NADPH-dependent curcumin reductase CurA
MGNALIDLAKAAGLRVIGVVGGEAKARFARDLERTTSSTASTRRSANE